MKEHNRNWIIFLPVRSGGHFNSVTGKWKLAKDAIDYYFSSTKFYEIGYDDFGFLNNIFKIFDGD